MGIILAVGTGSEVQAGFSRRKITIPCKKNATSKQGTRTNFKTIGHYNVDFIQGIVLGY